MPVPSYTVPAANSPTSVEEPKIIVALSDLKALLTGQLADDNINAGANLAGTKLAQNSIPPNRIQNQTPGKLLIASASGVVDSVAVTGDVTINNTGESTLGPNKVVTANILNDNVTDAKIQSPNNSVYRTIFQATSMFIEDSTTATYMMGQPALRGSPANFSNGPVVNEKPNSVLPIFRWTAAEYAVNSLTTKLNLQSQIAVGVTAPTANFAVGLYPVTSISGGGGDVIRFQLGTVLLNSTSTHTGPGALAIGSNSSGDFSPPAAMADGVYTFGVAVTASDIDVNSAVQISAQLRARNV